MKKFKDFLKEQLQDAEVKKEYERLDPAFSIAREVIRLRKKRGLNQQELAQKISSTQAVISRIENGSVNCSLDTLRKIGEALDSHLSVQLIPDEQYALFAEIPVSAELFAENEPDSFEITSLCRSLPDFFTANTGWNSGRSSVSKIADPFGSRSSESRRNKTPEIA